jgi:hypothetical protein
MATPTAGRQNEEDNSIKCGDAGICARKRWTFEGGFCIYQGGHTFVSLTGARLCSSSNTISAEEQSASDENKLLYLTFYFHSILLLYFFFLPGRLVGRSVGWTAPLCLTFPLFHLSASFLPSFLPSFLWLHS